MVKKISYGGIAVIILAVLFLGVVSASFDFVGENLRKSYAVGENIAGKIIISADGEPGESMIEGDFDGGMALFDLIKANNLSKSAYNCSTLQCAPKLTVSGGAINGLSLGNSEKIVGFKMNREDVTVQSIYLKIKGDAGQSCGEPLRVDVLGNEDWIVGSTGYGLACGLKNYGCFNSALDSESYDKVNIGYSDLCNEVSLSKAPAVELGAKITLGSGKIIYAELLDMNDDVLDSCELAFSGSLGDVQEASCIVNRSIAESGEYRVCVKASEDSSGYFVKSETSGDICGTGGGDYEVFARGMAFAANPEIIIDSNSERDSGITDYVQSYIYSNYLNDCSDGCIVPFKISGKAQQVTLNGKITYTPGIESESVYAIEEEMPEINSKRLELDVKYANLSVGDEGRTNYSIYLDGEVITEIPINVMETFSFDITPKYAPLGAAVKFSAVTDENITTSTWNFGDGTIETFYGKEARHIFASEGEYTIGVELASSDGLRAAKTFVIQTGSAESAVVSLTDKYTKRIANLTAKINSYPLWIGDELKINVDTAAMSAVVEKAKEDFGGNVSASAIVEDLIALRVPYAIATSKKAEYPLAKGYSGIDSNLAGQFYGREIDDAEAMRQGIVNWIGKSYDAFISVESISRYDDDGNSVILNHYTLSLTAKGSEDATLFINYPLNAIKFASSYGQREIGDGVAIPLSGNSVIEFAISEPVELSSLGIYMSPDVSTITPVSAGPISRALAPYFKFNSVLFWLGLLVLVVLFLIVYIMLQEWLKKNTERGLFPNPDELYNVVTFIHNSRRKNMGDGEIRKNLEKSGWRKPQIDYAFDRIDGKRAMFEIPIFRAAEQKKMREEIAKRGGMPAGTRAPESARFIKR